MSATFLTGCSSVPKFAYDWESIAAENLGLPLALLDVDGTLRGEVVPMFQLAKLISPNWRRKLTRAEDLNWFKFASFCRDVWALWKRNAADPRIRQHYKPLFSELHIAAVAVLQQTNVAELRQAYRSQIELMSFLWSPGAIRLLREMTKSMAVLLVTGSEQIQTQECVRLLSRYGVRTERIAVRGSLYGVDAAGGFSGGIRRLNVTLESKREAVADLQSHFDIRMAIGNSRSDRALFEVVSQGGFRCLVRPKRGNGRFRGRDQGTLSQSARLAFRGVDDLVVDDEGLNLAIEWACEQNYSR